MVFANGAGRLVVPNLRYRVTSSHLHETSSQLVTLALLARLGPVSGASGSAVDSLAEQKQCLNLGLYMLIL